MAYNALYGYDTGLYGYGPANMTGPSADGLVQPLQRTYPAWMQDIAARGIGNAEDDTQGVPAFIPLNSGPLTSPATQAPNATAATAATSSAPTSTIQSFSTTAEGGGNGGGAASQQDVNNGTGAQNLGPNPGNLGDLFGLGPSVSDIANIQGGASNVGDITGGNNGGPSGIGAGANLDPTGGGLGSGANLGDITGGGLGSGANLGDITGGDQSGSNAGNGGNADTSAGGAQGGGDVGSSSEIVGHAKGGIIGRNALLGPNPRGPDDGWGKLEVGEGVLTDKAIKFYGKGIVARLNRLEVPKARLRA